ncbi:MAG: gamma-glutamylcyclotransferase [Myxococcales bacterium]|nr:gamma-glutamylcyclotransferase [Myxococcales bacterium]
MQRTLSASPDRRLIFVYGTLLAGEPNHGELAGAVPVGPARTLPRFALVSLGPYPGLVPGEEAVTGELYLVEAAHLARLDAFEEHPEVYRRQPIPLAGGGEAEAYVLTPRAARGRPPLPGGDWRRASSGRALMPE